MTWIPKIIHYTFCNEHNLPNSVKEVIAHNKKICKDCEFLFYNDKDCDNFIRDHFDEDVYRAFKTIHPAYGAMRADFFRYCVLYKRGGVYIDIKCRINVSLFRDVICDDDICLLDIPKHHTEPWRIDKPTHEQYVLIFAPGHPYLKSMIELMVDYISKKYEPKEINGRPPTPRQKILHITGPDAFTVAVHKCTQEKLLHRIIDYDSMFSLHVDIDYKKMYAMNGRTHYSEVVDCPLYY